MKTFSYLSNMRVIGPFLIVITLFANCKKEHNSTQPDTSSPTSAGSTLTQTKTASFLNNLNNFQEVFGDQGYPKAQAQFVSADDDIYASTSELSANGNSASTLVLQGFGFTIPNNATIQNIEVRVRRFKTGTPEIGDHFLTLMQRFQCGFGPCTYGVFWTYLDDYPGKMYPTTETEYIFSQAGTGNNGEFKHDQAYNWTPAIVNHQYFGVRIDSYPPITGGTVVVNYDVVDVTVKYSLP